MEPEDLQSRDIKTNYAAIFFSVWLQEVSSRAKLTQSVSVLTCSPNPGIYKALSDTHRSDSLLQQHRVAPRAKQGERSVAACRGRSPLTPQRWRSRKDAAFGGRFWGSAGYCPTQKLQGHQCLQVWARHISVLAPALWKGEEQGKEPSSNPGAPASSVARGSWVLRALLGNQGSISRFPLCKTTDSTSWNSPNVCKFEIQALS